MIAKKSVQYDNNVQICVTHRKGSHGRIPVAYFPINTLPDEPDFILDLRLRIAQLNSSQQVSAVEMVERITELWALLSKCVLTLEYSYNRVNAELATTVAKYIVEHSGKCTCCAYRVVVPYSTIQPAADFARGVLARYS